MHFIGCLVSLISWAPRWLKDRAEPEKATGGRRMDCFTATAATYDELEVAVRKSGGLRGLNGVRSVRVMSGHVCLPKVAPMRPGDHDSLQRIFP